MRELIQALRKKDLNLTKQINKLLQAQVDSPDIDEALKVKDVLVGAEFEFIFRQKSVKIPKDLEPKALNSLERAAEDNIDISPWLANKAHITKKGWVLESERSLPATGGELVSPPLPLQKFLKICPQVFKAIDEVGYTTDKCGFHVGISTKKIEKINPLKVALFIDEDLVYKTFNKQARTKFGGPIKNLLKELQSGAKIDINRALETQLGKHVIESLKKTLTKHYGINLGKLQHGYIEFRYMGTKDYHKKWNKIKNIIGMYIATMKLALDPKYKKEEYREKLTDLFKDEIEKQKKLIAHTKKYVGNIEHFSKDFNLRVKKIQRSTDYVYLLLVGDQKNIEGIENILELLGFDAKIENKSTLKMNVNILRLLNTKIFKFPLHSTLQEKIKYVNEYREAKEAPKKLLSQFFESVEKGNLDVVKSLVNQGVNIRAKKDEALRTASLFGYLDIVKFLVSKGADIHAEEDEALREASGEGHLDIVKFLVSKGADIHAINDYALRWASEKGHLDIVEFLVSKGADIHAGRGYALRAALRNEHLDIVKFLINQGADIHAERDYALRQTSENGHLDIVKFLVSKGADIHAENDYALRAALGRGHLDIVKFLASKGANNHETLRIVSRYGYLDIVKFLVSKGADIHAEEDEALRTASQHGHLDIVKFLVSKGADIHAINDYALLAASENGHLDVVKFLVSKEANIHVKEDLPLRLASRYGHLDIVKFLVSKGADIHAGEDEALRVASKNDHLDVVRFLKSQIR